MLKDFKAFILRGNVVELAIAVAIGAAFASVISTFTSAIISPLIAIPGGSASFRGHTATIFGSAFQYGLVIDALITFAITAAVLFFFVVVPVNKLMARRRTEPDVESTTTTCRHCLSNIPRAATVCAFCTREVAAA